MNFLTVPFSVGVGKPLQQHRVPAPHLHPPALSVQGWSRFTSGHFQLMEVEGHHLWPLDKASKAAWLGVIAQQLAALQL